MMNDMQNTVAVNLDKLDDLIRRTVRDELKRLLQTPMRSIMDDWNHEGPEDPTGDQLLLQDALAVLQQYGADSKAWKSWEDFEAELDQAEAKGELSR